jgi:hypothetical protein
MVGRQPLSLAEIHFAPHRNGEDPAAPTLIRLRPPRPFGANLVHPHF